MHTVWAADPRAFGGMLQTGSYGSQAQPIGDFNPSL
jgi:hypothetical protein